MWKARKVKANRRLQDRKGGNFDVRNVKEVEEFNFLFLLL